MAQNVVIENIGGVEVYVVDDEIEFTGAAGALAYLGGELEYKEEFAAKVLALVIGGVGISAAIDRVETAKPGVDERCTICNAPSRWGVCRLCESEGN